MHVCDKSRDAHGLELLHLLDPVLLPIQHVWRLEDAHWPAREDGGPDRVGVVRAHHALLVEGPRPGLVRGDEARAHPDPGTAHGEARREPPAVEDAARADHEHGAAREWRGFAVHGVDDLGQQDGGRDVPRVAAALAPLRADDVHAGLECLFHVLHGANHVHHRNSCTMELVHSPLWGHAHGTYEERCLLFNDDVHELRQRPACVVLVGLPRGTPDLGQQQVHAKGRALVHKVVLEHADGLAERLRREPDAADVSQAAGIGHRRSELGACGPCHACKEHGVLDAE
mmetsp:Transcript_140147/g.390758  ORF Transcript_140147/g.390758 Transcript_140147/m.390758 type:complete len:285 (-) Transcript_140147:112-966(-)